MAADRHGRTLYRLSGENSHHLLCRSGACTAIWPPLTVASRRVKLRAGSGVHGKLGLIRRPDGKLQVTLRGLPLYRYSGDAGRGDANGQGIRSFGGTWTAVPASAAASAPAPAGAGADRADSSTAHLSGLLKLPGETSVEANRRRCMDRDLGV